MKNSPIQAKNQCDKENISLKISRFLKALSVTSLFPKANIKKMNGIAPIVLLSSIMTTVFSGKNFFRLYSSGTDGFKTDTVYRFLSNPNYNWRNLLLSISRIIIRDLIEPLTSGNRVKCYILDSSIYPRGRSKKVELLSWIYDHNSGLSVRGFQKLLLAWTDGFSTFPLQHALLSSRNESKRICNLKNKKMDQRCCGSKRRQEALTAMPDVAVDMLRRAKRWGINARYVLMDSWFCMPKTIIRIRSLRIHVIGMIKKSSKVHYLFEGKALDVKQIYRKLRKRRGRAQILASTEVQLKETGETVKIVFVRNRNKSRDWLALISTNVKLSDEEIIRIYGYRWNIEVLFKVAKHYLNLTGEIQCRDYDSLIAHSTIVLLRYCFLELERRNHADGRSHGELFYACYEEIRDISFFDSLKLLLSAFIDKVQNFQEITENTIMKLIDAFFEALENLFPQLLEHRCGS